MEQSLAPKVQCLSRDELYARVWQTSLTQLGTELGISNSGLAQICRRMHVPYPPRGYWAKKAAGKAVTVENLPPRPPHVPTKMEIRPAPPSPELPAEVQAAFSAAAAAAKAITVPETLDILHPMVKAWLVQHKQEQTEREREAKKPNRNTSGSGRPLIPDLTARDLYRFRVTSAIFKAVEAAGGRVDSASINGRIAFSIGGEKIECSIVEKLMQAFLAPKEDSSKWTAYPDHHQSGLTSSGFLRVTITTYLSCGAKQWMETATKKAAGLLPEVVGGIMAAGPIIVEQKREWEEQRRRHREEEERRHERQRLRQLDERRWSQFQGAAAAWHERTELLAFLVEVKCRFNADSGATADRQLSEWIAWAEQKVDSLDPFKNGLGGLFEKVAA